MNSYLTPTPSNGQTSASVDPIPPQPSDPNARPACPNAPAPSRPETTAPVSDSPGGGSAAIPGTPTAPTSSPAPDSQPVSRSSRKIRSDAKLLNLPPDQREQLIQWLIDGMAYSEARILVGAEFGIEIRCLNRFSEFWYRFCAPLLLKQRQQIVGAAHSHAALAPNDANALDLASFDAIRQRAYTAATSPGSSLEEVSFALAMISQVRSLEDNRRRLELDQARMLNRKSTSDSASNTTAATPSRPAASTSPVPTSARPQTVKSPRPRLSRRDRRAAIAAKEAHRTTAHRGSGPLALSL